MTSTDLVDRPYRAPAVQAGDYLYCEHHGGDVEVAGWTEAPIPWPAYGDVTGSRLTPILCGDLARAVRTESATAVAHWWGVCRDTVTRWRRKLGVGRMNAGTRRLWTELAPQRLSPEARRKGGARAGGKRRADHAD